ncbi:class I SAM-dependent methyltransferase [Candidatus Kaiserbacteria bacterium]|nr:class I SAM-dependent methyltransferase [Candidatus Kaiserbacteria bacterium]
MKQEVIAVRESCRVCGTSPLIPILSLGEVYVSDFIKDEAIEKEWGKYPLELVLCDKSKGGCGLLQLKHTLSHDALYRQYWYRSGVNRTMTEELQGIARKATGLAGLKAGDYVIDIGANDGTLLKSYAVEGLERVAYEPSKNIVEYINDPGIHLINDYFNAKAWKEEFGEKKAKAITAIAMFYDLEDPNAFMKDIKECLDDEGVFIVQQMYLPSMLTQTDYDNIGHEHLEYYALGPLEYLFEKNGLEICDAELNEINGGSFRVYARHKGKGKSIQLASGAKERVQKMRDDEKNLGLYEKKIYDEFAARAESLKDQLVSLVKGEVAKGKTVYVYGASTKGNTTLQFCNLGYPTIKAAAERNPDKWGLKTVGSHIPIISEEQARKEKPDYFLLLPWHFLEEFKEREKEFLQSGGKFIMPLPRVEVIGAE